MKKESVVFIVMIVIAAMMLTISAVIACPPTAHCLGADNANGNKGSNVIVPVDIIDVQNGPVPAIIFNILYNNSVITIVGAEEGELTENWEHIVLSNFTWGSRVAIASADSSHWMQNEDIGSVVLLNFSVIGKPGETSRMNFSDIQLSNPYGELGTAPAKNATFSVDDLKPPEPIPEFATIAIPAIAVLGLFLFFNKRKHRGV